MKSLEELKRDKENGSRKLTELCGIICNLKKQIAEAEKSVEDSQICDYDTFKEHKKKLEDLKEQLSFYEKQKNGKLPTSIGARPEEVCEAWNAKQAKLQRDIDTKYNTYLMARDKAKAAFIEYVNEVSEANRIRQEYKSTLPLDYVRSFNSYNQKTNKIDFRDVFTENVCNDDDLIAMTSIFGTVINEEIGRVGNFTLSEYIPVRTVLVLHEPAKKI